MPIGGQELVCHFISDIHRRFAFTLLLFGFHQAIQNAQLHTFLPRQGFAGQQNFIQGRARRDNLREIMGASHAGMNAQFRKIQTQYIRFGHGNTQVARQGEPRACSHGGSIHGTHHRNRNVANAEKRRIKGNHGVGVGVDGIILERPKPIQISTGRKCFGSLSCQDNGPNILLCHNIVLNVLNYFGKFLTQLDSQGIVGRR
mmetsp:Transcript_17904/g.37027  ORF Transcript_17904/g.37027 Transcript_17904/m.37027 type:complete len:201 (+) Transcript_17904:1479-2081(+)